MRLRKGVTAAIACAIAIGLVFAMVGGAFAGKKTVKVSAEMSGQDEVPPTGNGSGTADFKLKKKKKQVCFNISFEGLSSATTAAHIHKGDPGVNGAIEVPLFEGTQTSPAKDCVKAEKKLIKKIGKKPGDYYVNVHTANNVAGEIRGQLQKGASNSSGSNGGNTGGNTGGGGGGY
jgi:hypothetical protein